MSTKDYILLADIMGRGFAAFTDYGVASREIFYNEVYIPLTEALKVDNPRFDMLRFSYATSVAESRYDNA